VPQMRSKDMIVDEKPWLSGSWVLEYVDEASGRASGDTLGGLRVRASWLSQRELEKESAGSWDALVKLEQLIVSSPSIIVAS
jgi:hypothetical protein